MEKTILSDNARTFFFFFLLSSNVLKIFTHCCSFLDQIIGG